MIDLLVNSRFKNLSAYKSETEPFGIRLNLNESSFNITEMLKKEIQEEISNIAFNRYPDGSGKELIECISEYVGMDPKQIALGNGSDELICLLLQLFIEKGDKVMIHTPTFSMYSQYAAVVGAKIVEYETNEDFDIDIDAFKKAIEQEQPKVIFICNPNNPTGRVMLVSEIETLIKGFKGIAIIDEAYSEFYGQSALKLIEKYPNLVILRTLSKAMSLAGLRIGYLLGSEKVKDYIDRIRSPFNVNVYSQAVAKVILQNVDIVKDIIAIIKEERRRVYDALCRLDGVKAFDSRANFILFKTDKRDEIYKEMQNNGIKIRSFKEERLKDCLRVTIGLQHENDKMLSVLGGICCGK